MPGISSVALLLACFCLCTRGCLGRGTQQFSIGAVNCKLSWDGLPTMALVDLTCSPLQNVHVTPGESLLEKILQKAFDWMNDANVAPTKLSLSLSDLHLSFDKLNQKFDANFQTELLLNRCAIQSLKRDFFASDLFSAKGKGSVRFHNSKFAGVACEDLATAFNVSLNLLEFVNSSWCAGEIIMSGMELKNLTVRQPYAQPGSTLHLNNTTIANSLSVTVDSGWQPMRLGRVQPGHLILTGVQLQGPLGPTFLQGANLYVIRLTRCKLPPGASDDLLRNVMDVDNVLLDGTDLDNLPVARLGFSLSILEVSNCKLASLDFARLVAANRLESLKLANASIDRLPASWSLVANGSLLGGLLSINLTGNGLRWLPQVPNGRVYTDSSHFVVLIGGNPLHCDCGLKWLGASNEDDVRLVYRNDDPTCASPQHYRGMRVAEAFSKFDPCSTLPQPTAPVATTEDVAESSVLGIVVAVIVVMIVATVLIVLCCKFKGRVCDREGQGKAKYTAANKDEVTVNNKTTMQPTTDESLAAKPTYV